MSYTLRDAWIDEKSRGDWPFLRWDIGSLELRADFDYLRWSPRPGLQAIAYRLRQAFGRKKTRDDLSAALAEASEIVAAAIEVSETDAFHAWERHETWWPVLDESLDGRDHPAEMLADSLALVGAGHSLSDQEVCAAMGLWLVGEASRYETERDYRLKCWAVEQAGIALAEAEWNRGAQYGESQEKRKIANRNKLAASHRHEANRENKRRGLALWLSREWKVQADAERAIANDCHVEKEVAGRWIREFKRTGK